ncbi:hypothetical protein SAMN05192575_1057 [Nocardioides alpinus]|uniref:Uncharacterized protein n=1 Tax=Nocardioides alpinus TaxID=748909 RepID=A0A1I0Z3Q5_9ACTN|nr:hypothetical protein [Nocardioides alpinus]PKH38246.1 hypothetical protein CXG46_15905 [Nocardioides alpinus]SFB20245.1 hypothetical protein SAMN05192575_1057 [Nocardioides alpinus]
MPFGRKKSYMDRAHDYVEQLSETVLPPLESAWEQTVEKAGPALADARDKATPLIAEGRALAAEKAAVGAAFAAEMATEAREKAAPILAEARATAADKASVGAALAAEKASASRDLATAKVNELRGVEPEPQGSKLKKFLLVTGLLAVGGVVFSKLRSKQDEGANWQSTYVPPAPPRSSTPAAAAAPVTPATTSVPVTGDPLTDPLPDDVSADDVVTVDPPSTDDIGGGAPGEAISDSVEGAHEATTPDEPAEIIDIDDVPHKK